MKRRPTPCILLSGLLALSLAACAEPNTGEREYLLGLYEHLHANPELSFQERTTSARMARELGDIGSNAFHAPTTT